MNEITFPPAIDTPDVLLGSTRLCLVDGPNLAHRAFHALPETLTTSAGEPTNALLGFGRALHAIWREYCPDMICVAWEGRPQARIELYPAYKAHRAGMPDGLATQMPRLRELAEAYGCANVYVEGWEADDVIATLATQACEHKLATCIVSADRDAYQLVNDETFLLTSFPGSPQPRVVTPASVRERYGIEPRQVPDLIGLKGDPGDGIPGVPGVGEKTASALIGRYGTLEAVFAAREELEGNSRTRRVAEHRELALLSRELATMNRFLSLDLEVLLTSTRDRSCLPSLLERYELDSLTRTLHELP